jgi:hypothetical protein
MDSLCLPSSFQQTCNWHLQGSPPAKESWRRNLLNGISQLNKDSIGWIKPNQTESGMIEIEHHIHCHSQDHRVERHVKPASAHSFRHGVPGQQPTQQHQTNEQRDDEARQMSLERKSPGCVMSIISLIAGNSSRADSLRGSCRVAITARDQRSCCI